MLVNCPECHSPVFVRAAAVEQRKPQRCYACKAQLLVDVDGAVEVAVSGKLAAAPPGSAAEDAADVEATAIVPASPLGIPRSFEAEATKVLTSPFAQESGPPEPTLPAAPAPKPRAPPSPPSPPAPPSPRAAPAAKASPPAAAAPPAAEAKAPAPKPDPTPAPAARPPATAPRPVTVVTTMAALEQAERARLAALATQEAPEGPAPVTLESAEPLTVPRQASLPDLPVTDDADELPYGDATEVEDDAPQVPWQPSFEPLPEPPTAVSAAPKSESPSDVEALPSPFDASDEGPPEPAPRFSERPVEDLFDRSGAQLTPPSLDDIPTAAGVELPLSDEQPPVVAGSLLEAPTVTPSPAPAPVSAFDIDLQPLDVAPAGESEREPPPFRFSTEEDEPYVHQPPSRRSGGALGWMAALVVGAGLGLGLAYTYPQRPALAPLEQKVADAAALIGSGRPAQAVSLLEDVLREQPNHPQALRRLAIAASLAGDVEAAERHYLRYLAVSADEEDKRAVRKLLGLDDGPG